MKRNDFEVPESLVDRQIDLRLERGLRALAAQGMKMEDLKKMDLPRLRAGQRDQAVQDVKSSLLLERVAELEKIEVSEEELNHEIRSAGPAVETDFRSGPRSFDTGWGPR